MKKKDTLLKEEREGLLECINKENELVYNIGQLCHQKEIHLLEFKKSFNEKFKKLSKDLEDKKSIKALYLKEMIEKYKAVSFNLATGEVIKK
jgi:hypothetical protein